MAELTGEQVRRLVCDVAGVATTSPAPRPDGDEIDWHGLRVRVATRGSALGRMALVLATELAPLDEVLDRVPVAKLLEHTAGSGTVRVAAHGRTLTLESAVVWDEIDPARAAEVVRWRLAELFAVASAWRARLGLDTDPAGWPTPVATLAELKRAVRLTPDHALLVAAVAFGVAGADGVISPVERDKLRGWMADVPAFAGLELSRVVRSIATLVADPARALLESSRRLDSRGKLLAWALANDMAHADGFASEDERRYLANVAMVFKLSATELAPLAAEAQGRALHRETLEPRMPGGSA